MGLFSKFFRRGKTPHVEPIAVSSTDFYGGIPDSKETSHELYTAKARARKYREIANNVDIIGASLQAFITLAGSAEWAVSAPKEEELEASGIAFEQAEADAEWAYNVLHNMETPWSKVVRRLAMYIFYGTAPAAWTAIKRNDGTIGYAHIRPVGMDTIDRWEVTKWGEVLGLYQQTNTVINNYIPRSRLIHPVADSMGDSPEGIGLLRHVVPAADNYVRLTQLELYGYEVDLRGVPVGRAPISAIRQAIKDNQLTKEEGAAMIAALDKFIGNHIKNPQLGLRLDSATYKDTSAEQRPTTNKMWDLELLKGEEGPHGHINTALIRHQHSISRVLFSEHLMLGADGTGSLALSETKLRLYGQFIKSCLDELAWVCRKDVLKPLWLMNGKDLRTLPYLVPSAIDIQDIRAVTEALSQLKLAGMLPSDPAMDLIRARVNLPPVPDDVVQQYLDIMMIKVNEAKAAATATAPADDSVDVDMED